MKKQKKIFNKERILLLTFICLVIGLKVLAQDPFAGATSFAQMIYDSLTSTLTRILCGVAMAIGAIKIMYQGAHGAKLFITGLVGFGLSIGIDTFIGFFG